MNQKQILIDIDDEMSSVSLLESGRLQEHFVEFKGDRRISGNIYRGRVVNVLQGLQTAFVDIGLSKNGFLYVGETLDNRSDIRSSGIIPEKLDIKVGDYVAVQVTKEETAAKGARLSMNISLPGRHIVYLPTLDFLGVSNKISDENTRKKLMGILEKARRPGEGFIARTICLESKKSEILKEIKEMRALYKSICESYDLESGVSLIHSEENLLFRSIRDMLRTGSETIICNDPVTVERLKNHFKKQKSDYFERVELFESEYDMIDIFGVTKELDKLLERKIDLSSGGSIVIDRTEALTAIDVNTGRYQGALDHEETVFKTNMEAAKEIARQLRLRNIGGIIVVDFIDMQTDEHKNAVVELLRSEVVFDRIKTRVLDMSGLGLVEITRKKVGTELSSFLLDSCPVCSGLSGTHSSRYLARKMKANLKRMFAENNYTSALVTLNPAHIPRIISSGYFSRICENEWQDKRIYLIPRPAAGLSSMTMAGTNAASLNLPEGSELLY